jgi:hypothetical protein
MGSFRMVRHSEAIQVDEKSPMLRLARAALEEITPSLSRRFTDVLAPGG